MDGEVGVFFLGYIEIHEMQQCQVQVQCPTQSGCRPRVDPIHYLKCG